MPSFSQILLAKRNVKGQSPFIAMDEMTVDPNGVIKQLDRLNIHKASGPDGLNSRVLKDCRTEIGPVLAYIFNASLALGSVPDDWRQANMAPKYKKKGKVTPRELETRVAHMHMRQDPGAHNRK